MAAKIKPSAKEMFFKTKLCTFWQAGRCNRGKNCSFAHGDSKKSPLPDFYRTRLCPEMLSSGTCKNGADCCYAHSKADLRASVARPQGEGPSADEQAYQDYSSGAGRAPSNLSWSLGGPESVLNVEGRLPFEASEGDIWRGREILPRPMRPREGPQNYAVRPDLRQQAAPIQPPSHLQQPPQRSVGSSQPSQQMWQQNSGSQEFFGDGVGRAPVPAGGHADLEQNMDSMAEYLQALIQPAPGAPPSRPSAVGSQPGSSRLHDRVEPHANAPSSQYGCFAAPPAPYRQDEGRFPDAMNGHQGIASGQPFGLSTAPLVPQGSHLAAALSQPVAWMPANNGLFSAQHQSASVPYSRNHTEFQPGAQSWQEPNAGVPVGGLILQDLSQQGGKRPMAPQMEPSGWRPMEAIGSGMGNRVMLKNSNVENGQSESVPFAYPPDLSRGYDADFVPDLDPKFSW